MIQSGDKTNGILIIVLIEKLLLKLEQVLVKQNVQLILLFKVILSWHLKEDIEKHLNL